MTAVAASEVMEAAEVMPDPGIVAAGAAGQLTVVCTDGSAVDGASQQLRRAGWGAFFGHGHPANRSEALRGRTQTAQRAELRAVVAALEATQGWADIFTDSRFVH